MHTLTYGKISGVIVLDIKEFAPWTNTGITVHPGGAFNGNLAYEGVPTDYGVTVAEGAFDLEDPPQVVAKRTPPGAPDPVGLIQRVFRDIGGSIACSGLILENRLTPGFYLVSIDVSDPIWSDDAG